MKRVEINALFAEPARYTAEPVTVCGSECVNKSYPDFWVHYAALKGASL